MVGGASMRKKSNKRSNVKVHEELNSISSPSSPMYLIRKKLSVIAFALLIACAIVLLSISSSTRRMSLSSVTSSPHQLYTIEVVNEFPHDPSAFTQGLVYDQNDTLFESTGLYGKSSVRKVDLQTGKVKAIQGMSSAHFGEGLTLLGERLFQVTWLQNIGFIYDKNNLKKITKFKHQMKDGWGLATDGEVLFGTDGTSMLYQIDPQTLKVRQKQVVKYNKREVPNLNELEYINGELWANVWQTDCIARISPNNGIVESWILLHKLREGLEAAGHRGFDVLNGIAWDEKQNRLFVTGKLWPKLYEIKLYPVMTPFNGDLEEICIP